MTQQTDLFGHMPAQGSLFGAGDDRMQTPVRSVTPDPDQIRLRLHGLLNKASDADRMPWSERDARMWAVVVPQMANWLPDDEADQMRFDFARELERLRQAA